MLLYELHILQVIEIALGTVAKFAWTLDDRELGYSTGLLDRHLWRYTALALASVTAILTGSVLFRLRWSRGVPPPFWVHVGIALFGLWSTYATTRTEAMWASRGFITLLELQVVWLLGPIALFIWSLREFRPPTSPEKKPTAAAKMVL